MQQNNITVNGDNSNEFKLSKAVLFNRGIATFEKQATVDPAENSMISIRFNSDQMNDLLKSFSLYKLQGDIQIKGISYEPDTNLSQNPAEPKLDIDTTDAYLSMITELRGVTVKLTTVSGNYEGKILGIETRTNKIDQNNEYIREKIWVILGTQDKIMQILGDDITGLQITDPNVSKDLDFFLNAMKSMKVKESKNFNIIYSAKQKSTMMIRYLQEFPGWKLSYRMNIKEPKDAKPENEKEQNLVIQAWAVIDNILDENWDGINLTLVSGMPVSFIYDSYSPKWIVRPMIERKKMIEVKVATLQSGDANLALGEAEAFELDEPYPVEAKCMTAAPPSIMAAMPKPMTQMKRATRMRVAYDAAPTSLFDEEYEEDEDEDEEEMEDAFEAATEEDKGEGKGFRYKIATPISLKRNNSGLIPILQMETKGSSYCLYNEKIQQDHPMAVIEFKNQSEVSLEEGPIAIYKDAMFLGESILPLCAIQAKKRIPYSIDVEIRVKRTQSEKISEINEILYRNGLVSAKYHTTTTEYEIENVSEERKQLVLEKKIIPEYKLIDTPEPQETTKNYYEFRMAVSPKTKIKFTVKERRTITETIRIEELSGIIVDKWAKEKLISAETKTLLNNYLDMNSKFHNTMNDLNNMKNKIRETINDQMRIKENLKSLKESSEEKSLRITYIKKLVEDETELDESLKEMREIERKADEISLKLRDLRDQIYQNFKTA